MKDKFLVEDENNNVREAEVITIFDYNDKKYLLYSIPKDDKEDNIFVSEVYKDNEGYDNLKDIEDLSIKEELDIVIKELLNKINENNN